MVNVLKKYIYLEFKGEKEVCVSYIYISLFLLFSRLLLLGFSDRLYKKDKEEEENREMDDSDMKITIILAATLFLFLLLDHVRFVLV